MKQFSFAQFVSKELRVFKIMTLVFATVGVGFGVGMLVFYLKARGDQEFVKSMAPYLTTLVESGDRPELMKFSSFIAAEKGSTFRIVQDGSVFATSGSVAELDSPFSPEATVGTLFGSRYNWDSLISAVNLEGDGSASSAKAIIGTPMSAIGETALLAAIVAGLGSLALTLAFAKRLNRAINKSILPIENLDAAIRDLEAGGLTKVNENFEITELENVRKTLIQTRDNLEDAKDRLVEARAQELTANAYRRLIHDLHNPVAALSRLTELSQDLKIENGDRDAIVRSIGSLAQEVLRQVSANKLNISDMPKILKEQDLCKTILAASQTARQANQRAGTISFEHDLPTENLSVAHDPDLLRRAISNLVTNAIDACRSKIKVSIKKNQSDVTVSVSDDGLGLDSDQLTIFLQGRGRSTKADRDAVGLASVSHIVSTHGGRLVYRKSDLGGACFEVQLRGLV